MYIFIWWEFDDTDTFSLPFDRRVKRNIDTIDIGNGYILFASWWVLDDSTHVDHVRLLCGGKQINLKKKKTIWKTGIEWKQNTGNMITPSRSNENTKLSFQRHVSLSWMHQYWIKIYLWTPDLTTYVIVKLWIHWKVFESIICLGSTYSNHCYEWTGKGENSYFYLCCEADKRFLQTFSISLISNFYILFQYNSYYITYYITYKL